WQLPALSVRHGPALAIKCATSYVPWSMRTEPHVQTALPVKATTAFELLWRQARGIVIALLLVAATTVVAVLLRHYVGILRGSVLFLIPVMLAGYHLGVVPALIAAVAGVILSGYVYFAELYTSRVTSPQEALN